MKYYLVKKILHFIDSHGDPDQGGVEKYVVTENDKSEVYQPYDEDDEDQCNKSVPYSKLNNEWVQFDEIKKEEDLAGAEDGYNYEATLYKIKVITEEKYLEYKEIIEKYNKL